MKIIVAILVAISTVSATGRSGHFRPDPTEFSLVDALQYTCSDLLPGLEYLNYFSDHFGDFKIGLQPICTVFQKPGGPSELDATKFCNFVVDFFGLDDLDLVNSPGVGPQSKLDMLAYFFDRILVNTTRNLSGKGLNNLTTICPNAHRFFTSPFQKVLEEFLTEYYTELIGALIPEIESICQDWKSYFASMGVPDDSPYQQLIGSLVHIVPELMGFRSYENMCKKLHPWFGRDYAGRRWHANTFVTLMKEELKCSGDSCA